MKYWMALICCIAICLSGALAAADQTEFVSQEGVLWFTDGKNLGLKSVQGDVILSPVFTEVSAFYNNLAIVSIDDQKGVIDICGEYILPCTYQDIEMYDGAFIVVDRNGYKLIDMHGNNLSGSFAGIYENNGLFVISNGNAFGILDYSGHTICEPIFSDIGEFTEGWVRVTYNEKYCNYINLDGEYLLSEWCDFGTRFSDGWAAILQDDSYYFINAKGDIFESGYTYVDWYPSDGYFIACKGEKWCIFQPSVNCEQIINADMVLSLSNGLSPIYVSGLWGYCNAKGDIVVAPQYEYVSSFSEGRAYVKYNECYYYIDTEGNVISHGKITFANPFREGLAACVDAETGKMGFIDTNGRWTIAPEYDALGSFWFSNGTCTIYEIDGYVTIINRNGAIICEYLIQ